MEGEFPEKIIGESLFIQKKIAKRFIFSCLAILKVGVLGLEPRMTGPESVVLPLHHTPIMWNISRMRVQRYYFFINYQNFWAKIYKKPQNFRFSFVIPRFISTFVLQITHYYI